MRSDKDLVGVMANEELRLGFTLALYATRAAATPEEWPGLLEGIENYLALLGDKDGIVLRDVQGLLTVIGDVKASRSGSPDLKLRGLLHYIRNRDTEAGA